MLGATFLASVSGGALASGVFFVARQEYGFRPFDNLVLAAASGAAYTLVARVASRVVARLDALTGPRGALQLSLAVWGLSSLLPLVPGGGAPGLWGATLGGAIASAITWPVMQSFLGAGRSGPRLRAAIGWFNVTWTPATAVPLLLMPVFAAHDVRYMLALSAVTNLGAMAFVLRFPPRPGRESAEDAAVATPPAYPALLASVSWLLPLSYVMSFVLAPLLPERTTQVGVAQDWGGVVAATWMIARVVVLVAMWRSPFWHGRWGALLAAAVALIAGTGMALLGASVGVLVVGLALFGTGMALTYYAALYYRLAVGRGSADAGGRFESLVGLGSFVGPLVGIAAYSLARGADARLLTAGVLAVVTVAACTLAARPYRGA